MSNLPEAPLIYTNTIDRNTYYEDALAVLYQSEPGTPGFTSHEITDAHRDVISAVIDYHHVYFTKRFNQSASA